MKIKRKLALAIIFALLMTMLGGCGNDAAGNGNGAGDINSNISGTKESGTDNSGENAKDTADAQQNGEATAMGRYVETVTDLSERVSGWRNRLYRLEDGSILLTDSSNAFLISKDNGETWEEDKSAWRERLIAEEKTVMNTAVGADRTIVVIHSDYDADGQYMQKCLLIKPDGTEIPVEIPMAAEEFYPDTAAIAENGRIFISVLGSDSLYEIKEDGSCEKAFTIAEGKPGLMQFQGNLLMMDGSGYQTPLFYDIEKGEYIEDEVFADFVKTDYQGGNLFNMDDGYEMYFFAGEEDILYVAGEKGLHRHVIGGSAMEQVIDGKLCSFGNPANRIQSVVLLDNNEFLALFGGGKLAKFVYDANMPTVPNEKLKVYSLKENSTVQQAVSLYQAANPEVFLEYEVGITQGSSITREDALKKLNTEIMAGEGPDVLVLDNLPIDSYIEKGFLTDLTSFINDLDGENALFGNIMDAMKMQGGVYAIPCEIQIPVIAGRESYLSNANDLEGIADMMEALRRDNPQANLMNLCTEKMFLRFYAMVCVPAWTDADGNLNRTAITEYLEQINRIYHAQMDDAPKEILNDYIIGNDNWMESFGEKREDSIYLRESLDAMDYVGSYSQLMQGTINNISSYADVISLDRVKGFEDSDWRIMSGQSSNVFFAKTILGMNAASPHTKEAQDFINLCFSRENQSALFYGLPVNKAVFEEIFTTPPDWVGEDGSYLWQGSSRGDGTEVEYVSYWPDDEALARLKSCIESVNTAYMENATIEDIVYAEGILYLQGARSLEEAADNIEKKAKLYLSE